MAVTRSGETLAVVDGSYLLPLDDAVALLKLLHTAQRVESNWSPSNPFKFPREERAVTLTILTLAQVAQMHLESNPQ